jgi:xanthosine utilization system XapX-like protein
VTDESLLIGAAVFMLAFGVFVGVLERIRHPPATPVITFTGLAGVYLGLCATMEHVRWLYLPCLVLLLSVAATQLRASRRSGRDDASRRTGGTV